MTNIAELNALQARIDQLEAEAAVEHAERDKQRTTRRGMLRLAGAAAVGGLAATVAADPIAAADGGPVLLGVSVNAATIPTGIGVTNALGATYGLACYEAGLGALEPALGRPAVLGHALVAAGSAFTNGVAGHTVGGTGVIGLDTGTDVNGVGVSGTSSTGVGLKANGAYGGLSATSATGYGIFSVGQKGALLLEPFVPASPPARITAFDVGVLETDGAGNVWYCYEAGTPGKWRKLAGPASAGTFHAITPTRVYDSRAAAPSPGLLTNGNNRLVSVADGRNGAGAVTAANIVAAGATAVAANITITGTTGGFGYLAINPGGNTVEGASTINWSSAGLTTANGVTLTLNASRQLTVICGGGATASTHFLIDIAGYYL